MCGYIGFIGEYDQVQKDNFLSAFSSINHRGPDSSNIYDSKRMLLGHKRLSIIDLDKRSNQPFSNNNTHLLYNGEIYNYKELKHNLIKNYKCNFVTEGDTEVLFYGLKNEGIKFLQKIDGMFSLCFITPSGDVILARDRFGQKPLFYGFNNKKDLIFGSELAALLKIYGNNSLSINEMSFSKYFQFGASVAPQTFYNEFNQVCAGEAVLISKDKELKKEFWFNSSAPIISKKNIKSALTERLESCFVADTPIAILSSGGIDSSALIKTTPLISLNPSTIAIHLETKEDKRGSDIAKKIESSDLPLLSIKGYLDKQEMVNEGIDILLDRFAEPFADTSYFYSEKLYSEIPKKYKVIIGGDGADEVFIGYKPATFFFISSIVTRIVPLSLKKILITHFKKLGRFGLLFSTLLGCKESSEKVLMGFSSHELKNISKDNPIYSSQETFDLLSGNEVINFYESYLLTRLANVFMKKSDHASMISSKELRSPYLQGKFSEFKYMNRFLSFLIPKLKLKLYLARFVDITEIFRKKVGFDMVADANKDGRSEFIIKWCFTNRDLIESFFIFDNFINLIKRTKKDNHLFRIQIFLQWLQNSHEA